MRDKAKNLINARLKGATGIADLLSLCKEKMWTSYLILEI